MFWGQPFCKSCGYQGDDFMWSYHFFRSFGVLLQDRETLALRVVEIPDNDVFYRRSGEGRTEATEAYVAGIVARKMIPTERRVAVSEFVTTYEGEELTSLPCPNCRALLFWRVTGIT
jgi:hypothetical protein